MTPLRDGTPGAEGRLGIQEAASGADSADAAQASPAGTSAVHSALPLQLGWEGAELRSSGKALGFRSSGWEAVTCVGNNLLGNHSNTHLAAGIGPWPDVY